MFHRMFSVIFSFIENIMAVAHKAIAVGPASLLVLASERLIARELKTLMTGMGQVEKLTWQVRAKWIAINLPATVRVLV